MFDWVKRQELIDCINSIRDARVTKNISRVALR